MKDEELLTLDDGLVATEELSPDLSAALYFCCGYVSFKERVLFLSTPPTDIPHSDFVTQVSRGSLCYPAPELYSFARSCYFVFCELTSQSSHQSSHCSNRFHRYFVCLGDSYPIDFKGKLSSISRRLVNIFYKGFVRRETEVTKSVPNTSLVSNKSSRKASESAIAALQSPSMRKISKLNN